MKAETSFQRKKECIEPMKKSCLVAVITVLAAVATVEPEAAAEEAAPAEDAAE